jgi:hypothetical protein
LGWISGKNVLIDYRWANNNPDTRRRYAAEMIAVAPDVILTHSSPVVSALMEANRAVPIVGRRPRCRRLRRKSRASGRFGNPIVQSSVRIACDFL